MKKLMLIIAMTFVLTGCSSLNLQTKEAAHGAIDAGAKTAHSVVDIGYTFLDGLLEIYNSVKDEVKSIFSSDGDSTTPEPVM